MLSRFFGRTGRGSPAAMHPPVDRPHWPRFALWVLALTLAGFALSSVLGVEPVWFAAGGAIAISASALVRRGGSPAALIRSGEPAFLLFVLALGVIVATASENGLESAVGRVLPDGSGLVDLLAIAAACAVLANLVNNLPAILITLPALAAAAGPGPVLAALIGVNVGPNLTYVGSLATLLWRRVMHAQDEEVELGEFLRLGALTVPAVLAGSTAALWLSARWFGDARPRVDHRGELAGDDRRRCRGRARRRRGDARARDRQLGRTRGSEAPPEQLRSISETAARALLADAAALLGSSANRWR